MRDAIDAAEIVALYTRRKRKGAATRIDSKIVVFETGKLIDHLERLFHIIISGCVDF
jgi:hypothetical protein